MTKNRAKKDKQKAKIEAEKLAAEHLNRVDEVAFHEAKCFEEEAAKAKVKA